MGENGGSTLCFHKDFTSMEVYSSLTEVEVQAASVFMSDETRQIFKMLALLTLS